MFIQPTLFQCDVLLFHPRRKTTTGSIESVESWVLSGCVAAFRLLTVMALGFPCIFALWDIDLCISIGIKGTSIGTWIQGKLWGYYWFYLDYSRLQILPWLLSWYCEVHLLQNCVFVASKWKSQQRHKMMFYVPDQDCKILIFFLSLKGIAEGWYCFM